MTLGVNGYLELYTTLLGWEQYQNLWDIALKSGIVFIPFIAIIYRNIIEPAKIQQLSSASFVSLKRMEFDLIGMLLFVVLCAQPAITLAPTELSYLPICQAQKDPVTPGNTGTTYDKVFPIATGAKVPIVWYAIMSISHAVTRAAILGLPCEPFDYRALHNTLMASKIHDPAVRQQTTEFYQNCYVQALAKYDREKPDISIYTKNTGNADTQWMGSTAFLGLSGYYDTLSASTPVSGFVYDPDRDFEYGSNHGQWGRPTCQEWWLGTDGDNGLRAKLLKSLPTSLFSFLESKETAQNNAIKALIQQTYQNGYESLNDQGSGNFLSNYIGKPLGIAAESLSAFPKLQLIKESLPVIQAVCLMLIYIFLAFAQPFALYRIKLISIGGSIIFSITFWSFIWHTVSYLDQILIQSLYPNMLGIGSSPQQNLVEMVIGTCYILGPVLWTLFLSWFGIQAGNGIAAVMGGAAVPAMEAGAKAGGLAQQGITTAARSIKL